MIDAVVKLGGKALEDAATLSRLAAELRELAEAGRWIALVHGGGDALDRHLAARGFTTVKKEGIRVTPPEQIGEIVGVLCGALNKQLVSTLQQARVKAVGLAGADAGSVRAEKLEPGFDPGRVGRVVGGNPSLVLTLCARGFVPVFASIAPDAEGNPLNINADSFAAGLARVCEAKRLVLLTDVPGVLGKDGKLTPRLTVEQAENWIGAGTIHGGMIPKVRAALGAAAEAGCEVVISSWNDAGAIRRIVAGEAAGTAFAPSQKEGALA